MTEQITIPEWRILEVLMPSTYMLCDALDSLMKRFNARSFDLQKHDGADQLS